MGASRDGVDAPRPFPLHSPLLLPQAHSPITQPRSSTIEETALVRRDDLRFPLKKMVTSQCDRTKLPKYLFSAVTRTTTSLCRSSTTTLLYRYSL